MNLVDGLRPRIEHTSSNNNSKIHMRGRSHTLWTESILRLVLKSVMKLCCNSVEMDEFSFGT